MSEVRKSSELRFTREELSPLLVYEQEDGYGDSYSRSGWRLYKIADIYYITYFSHCSCADTWDCITITEEVTNKEDYRPTYKYRLVYLWSGTASEILEFSRQKLDPHLPDREISCKDFGFECLYNFYKWIDVNVKIPVPPKLTVEKQPSIERVSSEFISLGMAWTDKEMAKKGLVRQDYFMSASGVPTLPPPTGVY